MAKRRKAYTPATPGKPVPQSGQYQVVSLQADANRRTQVAPSVDHTIKPSKSPDLMNFSAYSSEPLPQKKYANLAARENEFVRKALVLLGIAIQAQRQGFRLAIVDNQNQVISDITGIENLKVEDNTQLINLIKNYL